MLAHLSPDLPRGDWIKVGMALKSELGEAGFEPFDEWSSDGTGYRVADVRSAWRSIKAGGKVTGGTLVSMAQAAGWKPADKPRRPSAQERKAQAAARREAAEREARETAAQHQQAAGTAGTLWGRGGPAEPAACPYLQRKGIGAHGVRMLADGTLLIPLRDAAGTLWNVQTIAPRRPAGDNPEKRFLKGGRKAGLWHLIGPPLAPGAWLMLCEGYATGASVHEATGRPVAVAFDAGNLQTVAQALRTAFPGVRLAVAGDDDHPTARRTGHNPGREAAEAVATACNGPALLPRFTAATGDGGDGGDGADIGASVGKRGAAGEGHGQADTLTDWNDLHQSAGLDAVRDQIEAGLRAFDAATHASATTDAAEAGAATAGTATATDKPSTTTATSAHAMTPAASATGSTAHADGPANPDPAAADEDRAAADDRAAAHGPDPGADPADEASTAPGGSGRPPGKRKPPAARGGGAGPRGDGGRAAGRGGAGPHAGEGGDAPPESFTCDDSGLWRYLPAGRDGEGGGWRRVCDPLRVEALARDHADGAASLVLSFRSVFGQDRRLILPLSGLAGDGGAWRGTLADAGFPMPADVHRRRWLHEYLTGARPERHARLTERTGWHGSAYVLSSGETIGGDEAEPVLFAGERPDGGPAVRGDLERWRWLIGRHCVGQTRLAFAVAVALAGPCLAWAGGMESGGVHLVGDSSTGKTTLLRVGGSVWGGPGYLQRWRATDNGLETLCAAHSDLTLCLDELAQLEPRVAGESAYLIANGSGKVRAGRTGGGRPRLSWRTLVLSSGEVSLSDHMAEAGKRPRAGQELRFVDLPADAGKGCGAFDHRGDFEDPAALAKHLNEATARVHGALGRAWLEHLAGRTDTLARELRERMARFEAQAVPEAASGQVGRVARRFALVAAAGEMATAAGLIGWPEGQAQAAALRMFNAWIETRPAGIGASEDAAILRQIRAWFSAHGEARFTSWDRLDKESDTDEDRRPQTMHRAGWRRRVETKSGMVETECIEWLCLPEIFREDACRGFRWQAVLRLLDKRGHLVREKKDEMTSRVYVSKFGKAQVYIIRSTLLDETDA